MALSTHSKFYYGHIITTDNNAIDFSEGGGELQATLANGSYTLTEFADEIVRAMDAAGALTYSTSIDRTTRKITISSTATFELLVSTGTRAGATAYTLAGFTGADRTGASSYEGDSGSGKEYTTQFILQSYVPSSNFKRSTDASVNKSASGRVEVVKFGEESFIEFNMRYITDIQGQDGTLLRNRATGVADLRDLLDDLIEKSRFEFMEDENTPTTFEKVILESTPSESDGTGYRLREQFDRGLPGYFDTGILRLRVIV